MTTTYYHPSTHHPSYHPSAYGSQGQPMPPMQPVYTTIPSQGYPYPGQPQVGPSSMGAPVAAVPGYGYPPYQNSLGARLRRFFGFAPATGFRYRSSHDTWGFMGYSRRQRYIDARTGGEVDRQGRPVFRVYT